MTGLSLFELHRLGVFLVDVETYMKCLPVLCIILDLLVTTGKDHLQSPGHGWLGRWLFLGDSPIVGAFCKGTLLGDIDMLASFQSGCTSPSPIFPSSGCYSSMLTALSVSTELWAGPAALPLLYSLPNLFCLALYYYCGDVVLNCFCSTWNCNSIWKSLGTTHFKQRNATYI